MSQPAAAHVQRRRNGALWAGGIIILLGVLSNFLYFINAPGQAIFPWISLALPAVALVFLFLGVRRAFAQPEMSRGSVPGSILFGRVQVYRGKVSGSILAFVGLVVFALSLWGFFYARALPSSSGAPKIGEKAPDFTLTNASGQAVSLAELLATPIDPTSGKAPKAVLLIFYRGWW